MKKRLVLAVGGGLGLLVVISIVMSLVLGGGGAKKDQLVALAQQQNELIRVAEIGVEKGRNAQARQLAVTAQLSLTSEQAALQSALKTQGVKVGNKELIAGKNTKTDTKLTQAEQTNRFDEVFLEHLKGELVSYQKNLKTAYDEASSKKFKDALAAQYEKAAILAGVDPER